MKKKYILVISAILLAFGTFSVIAKTSSDQAEAYRRDFHGEGVVVAIIDGGADINHPDLKLSSPDDAKLSKDMVQNIIAQKGLKGKYVNAKIPYIHDYYHNDNDIYSSNEHGLHVAGIVGANGENKGVAPEVQLLLMKVFPDAGINTIVDSSKYYVQAIEDAIVLQADIINLSLGTGAGADHLLDKSVKEAIKKAKDAGIIVNASCGNNGYFAYPDALPKSDNPDYGVISMPAILPETVAVASLNGDTLSSPMIVSNGKKYPYQKASKDALSIADELPYGKDVQLIDVGEGTSKEYDNLDTEGKIVIAKKGRLDYTQLHHIALQHRVAALVVYSATDMDEEFTWDARLFSLPVARLREKDAKEIITNAKKNKPVVFLNEKESYPNSKAGVINSFSAWGVTNEGLLKPDITAPGGNILSLANHGEYTRMTGTSMAAPYISGVAALTLQRLNETYDQQLTPLTKAKLVRKIMMSTAIPKRENNVPISPRKQGSGVVNIKSAVTSKVVAYIDEEKINLNLGKVEKVLTVPVTLENISKKKICLRGKYQLLTDIVKDGRFTMHSKLAKESSLSDVVLNPKEKKKVIYKIDIHDIQLQNVMPNGFFIDGFIDYNYGSTKTHVGVAFTSFKGQFNKLPCIETPIYDLPNGDATYIKKAKDINDFTYFGSDILVNGEAQNIVLGESANSSDDQRIFKKENIAISPNNDQMADHLDFNITALRTYQKIKIDILDSQKNIIATYSDVKKPEFIKSYYGGNQKNQKSLNIWQYVPQHVKEGKYFARVVVQHDLKDNENMQSFIYPFYIDNTAPKLISSIQEGDYLTLKCEDQLSGIYSTKLLFGTREIECDKDGRYNIKGIKKQQLRLVMQDYAYNEVSINLK